MNYNPRIDDQQGRILLQGYLAAAQAQQGGDQALAQGITSAAGSIAGGIQGYQKVKEERDTLGALGEYYFANDPEKAAKFAAASLGAQKGMIGGQVAEQARAQLQVNNQMKQKEYYLNEWKAGEDARQFGQQLGLQKERAEAIGTLKVEKTPGGVVVAQNPGTGTFQILSPDKTQAAPPDGTIARDAQGNVLGVYGGGKIMKDDVVTRWNVATGQQELVNKRTGEVLGGSPAAAAQAPAAGGPPTVTTREEFDALPSGSTYLGRDGRTYRKP